MESWTNSNSEYVRTIQPPRSAYAIISKSIHRKLKAALDQLQPSAMNLPLPIPTTFAKDPFLIHIPTLCNNAFAISNQFGLSGRQKLAYKLFINGLLSDAEEIRNRSYSMFVTGFGGVGKSHLIHALKSFFGIASQYLPNTGLLLTATTGAAAALIDGATVDSALNLHVKTLDLPALQSKFRSVTHLIIDECSMLGAEKLHQIDFVCKLAKGNEQDDFGGIIVMLTGDLKQLPPVLQVPLFRNQNALHTVYAETKRKQLAGLLLFQSITYTIILRRQHRIKSAPAYETLLINLRRGILTNNDLTLLQSRQLTNLDSFDPSLVTNFIFTNNSMRTAVNESIINQLDGQISLTSVASDHLQGQKRLKLPPNIPTTDELYRQLQLLEDAPKRPRYHQHIVVGMKIIIKQNLFPELNVVNGSVGIIHAIPPQCTNKTLPCHEIPWIAVEFPHLPDRPLLAEFPARVLPIAPYTTQFTYEGLRFTRKQFPITPAYAMTVHGAQGRTLTGQTVIQLQSSMSIQEVYVEMSRIPEPESLLIMGEIPKKFRSWPSDLLSFIDMHLIPNHERTLSDHLIQSLIDPDMIADLNIENQLDLSQNY